MELEKALLVLFIGGILVAIPALVYGWRELKKHSVK